MRRAGVLTLLIVALVSVGTTAWAVSDGQYRSGAQHCSGKADDSDTPSRVEAGCTNAVMNINDGTGPEWLFLGFQQTADGKTVDPTKPVYAINQDPNSYNPTRQLYVYFGADDNLDNGEHDSSPIISNGPSDGGAIAFYYQLASVTAWFNALKDTDFEYLLRHPLPIVSLGGGQCADGVCAAATTNERIAYSGSGQKESQPVADYSGKTWDPETCGGPTDTPKDCGPGGIGTYYKRDGQRTTEPGVQIFEDPDPQGSPIGPYPLPALYAGSCGVILGGGALALPDSPVTNSAHQLVIETGC